MLFCRLVAVGTLAMGMIVSLFSPWGFLIMALSPVVAAAVCGIVADMGI